ncbi:MAG TPA: hypothetical protein VK715_00275, partial [Steroidobacteraceae bacterium]|nr:hypothetical protein [Steroidobacteraceae bacterium]
AGTAQSGESVPDVPHQKFDVDAEYTTAVLADQTGYLRLNWNHLGNISTGFTYNAVRPAYSALDAAVGVRTAHYDLSLYGRNLTNSNGILDIKEGAGYSFGNVFTANVSAPPRTVGIDLKMHF